MNKAQKSIGQIVGQHINSANRQVKDEYNGKAVGALNRAANIAEVKESIRKIKQECPNLFTENALDLIPITKQSMPIKSAEITPQLREAIAKRLSEIEGKANGSCEHFYTSEIEDTEKATASLWPRQRMGENYQQWCDRMIFENTRR